MTSRCPLRTAQVLEFASLCMPEAFHIYLYGMGRGPIPITFEQLAERLSNVERIYFEMDGSFVWTGESDLGRWQLDGMVYDAAGSVQYIDLKGWCPWSVWNFFLRKLSGDEEWSEAWTVLRLPAQQEQTLAAFNQETWNGRGTL